jgi:LemA protein
LLSKPQVLAGDLDSLLSRIFAIAERYPDLRLSENFQRFMDALVDAEDKIAEQRMVYNERANIMSTAVDKFPGFIFAKVYGFEPPPFFEPEDEARWPPNVEQVTP